MSLESLCYHLNTIGRRAWIVTGAPELDTGFFSRETRAIAMQGSPIDLVTMRMRGVVGPRQLLGRGAFRVSIGGVPIAGRTVLPMQTHWIVRLSRFAHPWFATKLVRRGGLGFAGDGLGDVLSRDAAVLTGVAHHTAWDDGLEIAPVAAKSVVRIVHKRPIATDVFGGGIQQTPASPELIACFERIAAIIKSYG